ncbi:MAG: Mth938-like domain-containing protein [Proteobacteria bacterium]|nr:Mth938-like domain-containing protein [Pseudomonadota bacterium]
MDITPEIPADRKYIDHYGDGGFRVGGERYEGSLIVAPEQVWPWAISDITQLTAESVAVVLTADPSIELLLIGCGARVERLPQDVREALRSHAIIVDGMETGAACRTYNVLMAEERRVAVALIAI